MSDTVDTALPVASSDAVEAQLIGYLQNAGASVTDWNKGRFIRTMMKLWSTFALPDVKAAIRVIAKGGFLLEAGSDWLDIYADQKFNLTRNVDLAGNRFANTFTQQLLTLTCAPGTGPYTFGAGTLMVRSPVTGNRYRSISTVTVPGSGSAPVVVQAESANDSANGLNYADAPGTLTVLDDPRPGLSASNLSPVFSGVSAMAEGLGVVTVGGSAPVAPTAYEVEVTTSGQVGVAVFQYRANGGPWIVNQTTAASFVIPSGPTIHFANDGGGSNPSFIVGDEYSFTSPGSPVIQQGLDPESDAALLLRCQQRWPSLDDDDETDKHETWARESSPLITRVRISLDPTYPGRLLVTIAGATNPLSGGVVSAAQLFIDQREGITDLSLVAAATVTTVTATAVVTVAKERSAIIQAAAKLTWDSYVSGLNIGGTIRLAQFVKAAIGAGASDVTGEQLNGSPTNFVLGTNAVGVAADITSSVTWVEV